jgi:hypothetical protein
VLGAETGNARLRTGAYQFWRLHVRSLADQAAVPNPDALAGILLAPLWRPTSTGSNATSVGWPSGMS